MTDHIEMPPAYGELSPHTILRDLLVLPGSIYPLNKYIHLRTKARDVFEL